MEAEGEDDVFLSLDFESSLFRGTVGSALPPLDFEDFFHSDGREAVCSECSEFPFFGLRPRERRTRSFGVPRPSSD